MAIAGFTAPEDLMALARTILAVAGLEKTSGTFKRRLVDVASALGLNADFFAAVMSYESASTFSPNVLNPVSGAVGLIQFTGPALKEQRLTREQIARMSAEAQLVGPVREYYRRRISEHGKLETLADHYLAVFAPIGIGKGPDFVLYSQERDAEIIAEGKHPQYAPNSGLDVGNKGFITATDAAAVVQRRVDDALGRRLAVPSRSADGLFFTTGPGDELVLFAIAALLAAAHHRRRSASSRRAA